MKREHIWAHHEQDANMNWKLLEGGYASRISVKQGEEIAFHISNSRAHYDIFIFREGARRELVRTIHDRKGELQAVPERGYAEGFGWSSVASFDIPEDWKSGIYIASFATGQGMREIFFIVRPKVPRAPLLLTIATNTYQAYNNVGGKSLYDYISTERQMSRRLSFERPFQINTLGNFYIWDQFFTSWLDAENFEMDYCANSDHDLEPELLSQYKANLRIGHDEYNSLNEVEQLQSFIAGGGNFLVFTGNAFCWKVQIEEEGRIITCEKPSRDESCAEHPSWWINNDQARQKLLGVLYTSFVHAKTETPGVFLAPTDEEFGFYRVSKPDHWIYEGTGLKAGDEFGREDSIVGVEADAPDIHIVNGVPKVTGKDGVSKHFEILALGDAKALGDEYLPESLKHSEEGECPCYATVAINESEFEGTIFSAPTIEWGHGLQNEDSPVAQITRNVLKRLGQ